jgi:hypothetical protein
VPIRPFLDRDDAFGPEDIASMSAAFEAALGKLGCPKCVELFRRQLLANIHRHGKSESAVLWNPFRRCHLLLKRRFRLEYQLR